MSPIMPAIRKRPHSLGGMPCQCQAAMGHAVEWAAKAIHRRIYYPAAMRPLPAAAQVHQRQATVQRAIYDEHQSTTATLSLCSKATGSCRGNTVWSFCKGQQAGADIVAAHCVPLVEQRLLVQALGLSHRKGRGCSPRRSSRGRAQQPRASARSERRCHATLSPNTMSPKP